MYEDVSYGKSSRPWWGYGQPPGRPVGPPNNYSSSGSSDYTTSFLFWKSSIGAMYWRLLSTWRFDTQKPSLNQPHSRIYWRLLAGTRSFFSAGTSPWFVRILWCQRRYHGAAQFAVNCISRGLLFFSCFLHFSSKVIHSSGRLLFGSSPSSVRHFWQLFGIPSEGASKKKKGGGRGKKIVVVVGLSKLGLFPVTTFDFSLVFPSASKAFPPGEYLANFLFPVNAQTAHWLGPDFNWNVL